VGASWAGRGTPAVNHPSKLEEMTMSRFKIGVWVTREFPKGFTNIIKGDFVNPQSATQGATDLFCYDRNTGVGSFFATVRNGRLDDGTPVPDGPRKVGGNHTYNHRWTHVVYVPFVKITPQPGPFPRPPKKEFFPLFFYYDTKSGAGQVDQLDLRGGMSVKKRHTDLHTGITHIIAGRFGSKANLFCFNPSEAGGTGTFYAVNESGDVKSVSTIVGLLSNRWHSIIKGNFSDGENDDLLFYNKQEGFGEFYQVDDKAGMKPFARHTDWRRTWQHVVSGQFLQNSKFDGLMFYGEQDTFHTEFYSTDGHGRISRIDIDPTNQWRLPWQAILPGEFTPNIGLVGTSRFCNYDSKDGALRYLFIEPVI
jgi:hypothetical protein